MDSPEVWEYPLSHAHMWLPLKRIRSLSGEPTHTEPPLQHEILNNAQSEDQLNVATLANQSPFGEHSIMCIFSCPKSVSY
jgi:hypothetical protein